MAIQNLTTYIFEDFHRWPLWLPVLHGLGIAFYFFLPFEPPSIWAIGGILFFLFSLWCSRLRPLRLIILSIGFISLGFSAALYRTHSLNTIMLHYPLRPLLIEGRVSQVELKPTKKGDFYQRLILVDLKANTPEKLPQKIRLTMKGKRERLWPGQVIRIRMKLNPISDPSIPGGFDFRRQSYYQGIGATAFALSPPEVLKTSPSWDNTLEMHREKITAYFLAHMKQPTGGIAAALITGDKAAIPNEIREFFIRSGLAHILAISGLHLSIIAGVVFLIIRRGIALIPPLCLAFNSKKIAAFGTILITLFYLILSGFGIPAQRAFIMISIVMGAVLFNRTALSLRTVALAAFVILLLTPEALLSPSFQLSFAAVIALITGYEAFKNPLALYMANGGYIRRFIIYAGGLAFTSLLATLATLPFTIALFHRFSLHAIEANLLAVPLTSLVIMPSALLTCLLAPFGIGEYPLWVFERSLEGLIYIASTVASWPGANIWVARPSLLSFLFVVIGGLWLCLWQVRWRRWGLLPMALGCLMTFWSQSPHLLIDDQAKIAALYDNGTLYVSSMRRGKFTAETWQQSLAANIIEPLDCENGICKSKILERPVLIFEDQEKQRCVPGAILIHLEPKQASCPDAFIVLDRFDVWRGGSHAIWITPNGYSIEKARDIQGNRPWTGKAIPRKNRPGY